MPYYGTFIGEVADGRAVAWLVELDDDGTPTFDLDADDPFLEMEFIPVHVMPDVVPVWTIDLRESVVADSPFNVDEMAEIGILKMRYRMAMLQGRHLEE